MYPVMYIGTAREAAGLDAFGLTAGKRYLLEDVNAGELLARELVDVERTSGTRPLNPAADHNDKRILIVRPGGFGDLLFLTPSLREIKRRWPRAHVDVACWSRYAEVFGYNPDVDLAGSYPVPLDTWFNYDATIWLENALERGDDSRTLHAVDLFAQRLNLGDLPDKRLRYIIAPAELDAARAQYPRTEKKRIAMQVYASARCRTYPEALSQHVCQSIILQGHELFLFGDHGSIRGQTGPGLVNLTQLPQPPSFRESAAILATCDALIAPDSALTHLAGALEIPTLALYGPFPWQLRTAYAPSIHAMAGHGDCEPCFHHARGGQHWPAHGPCNRSRQCDVLATITPGRILAKLEKLLR
jgi:ADP-heptose:LPS heptosyltransferase